MPLTAKPSHSYYKHPIVFAKDARNLWSFEVWEKDSHDIVASGHGMETKLQALEAAKYEIRRIRDVASQTY